MAEPAQTDTPTPEPAPAVADNLVAALARAQAEFPTIQKTKTGEVRGTTRQGAAYSYTYSYADLADVLSAARPVLAREGIALLQRLTTGADGKVRLVTELRRGDEVLDSEVELGKSTAEPQQFGGALTYLRRYCASTMLGIAPEEDLDAQQVQPAGPDHAPAPAPVPDWATFLSDQRVAAELAPPLKLMLGEERAKAVYRSIKASLGGVPAVFAPFAKLLADELVGADEEALINRLGEEARARLDAERAAQDQAAEAPDTPAPEPVADTPPPDPEGDAAREKADEEEGLTPAQRARAAAAGADAARVAKGEAEPPPNDPSLSAAFKPERDVAADTTAPAGTVTPPDVSQVDTEAAVMAFRLAGCICEDPLGGPDVMGRDDGCPIATHGIAF